MRINSIDRQNVKSTPTFKSVTFHKNGDALRIHVHDHDYHGLPSRVLAKWDNGIWGYNEVVARFSPHAAELMIKLRKFPDTLISKYRSCVSNDESAKAEVVNLVKKLVDDTPGLEEFKAETNKLLEKGLMYKAVGLGKPGASDLYIVSDYDALKEVL